MHSGEAVQEEINQFSQTYIFGIYAVIYRNTNTQYIIVTIKTKTISNEIWVQIPIFNYSYSHL